MDVVGPAKLPFLSNVPEKGAQRGKPGGGGLVPIASDQESPSLFSSETSPPHNQTPAQTMLGTKLILLLALFLCISVAPRAAEAQAADIAAVQASLGDATYGLVWLQLTTYAYLNQSNKAKDDVVTVSQNTFCGEIGYGKDMEYLGAESELGDAC